MSRSSDHGAGPGSVYALVLIRAHKEMLARGIAAEALLEHTGLDDAAYSIPIPSSTGSRRFNTIATWWISPPAPVSASKSA